MTGAPAGPGTPPAADPWIAIVVVNFGSHELIERNLAPLDLAALGARVIVVDNFRSAGASAAIAAVTARHGWTLLPMATNAGFGIAVNAGAAHAITAGADVVVTVNPDLLMPPDVLDGLAAAVRADPKTAVSPRIVRPGGLVWFAGAHLDIDDSRARLGEVPDTGRRPPWLSGACLAVHRDLWEAVGGFDADYFLYWEDVDLSYRMLRAGARLDVRHDLEAVHDVGGTQEAAREHGKSATYYYWCCRNRLVFAAKHLDRDDRRRWVRGTPADVKRVLLRGGRRQFLTPWRSLWPGLRGTAAGLLWMRRHGGGRVS